VLQAFAVTQPSRPTRTPSKLCLNLQRVTICSREGMSEQSHQRAYRVSAHLRAQRAKRVIQARCGEAATAQALKRDFNERYLELGSWRSASKRTGTATTRLSNWQQGWHEGRHAGRPPLQLTLARGPRPNRGPAMTTHNDDYARQKLYEALCALVGDGPIDKRMTFAADTLAQLQLQPNRIPPSIAEEIHAVHSALTKTPLSHYRGYTLRNITTEDGEKLAQRILGMFVTLMGGLGRSSDQ
jgi:hypothetical protein